MKEIKLLFYQTSPSPENLGMKIVLFEIDTPGNPIYDYGMCDWLGAEWDVVPQLEGHQFRVYAWANWPDPKHLTNDRRIITM